MATAVPYVVRPEDRLAFRRCRRKWDFRSRERRGVVPTQRREPLDAGQALREALSVYYHPGMWHWQRALVQPLARKAFRRSLDAQQEEPPGAHAADLTEAVDLGESLLDRYFAWCPSMDDFEVLHCEAEFDVVVPDPTDPEQGLTTRDGEQAVRYRGRPHLVTLDEDGERWIVEHLVVEDDFTSPHQLRLDDRGLSFCWAWERFYPGMQITGTVYNELRLATPLWPEIPDDLAALEADGGADAAPDEPLFRRTALRRTREEIERAGDRLAREARLMSAMDVFVYPSPSPESCGRCPYRSPCRAMQTGGDVDGILAAEYRDRPSSYQPGRIGDVTWSTGRGAAPPPQDSGTGDDATGDSGGGDHDPDETPDDAAEDAGPGDDRSAGGTSG